MALGRCLLAACLLASAARGDDALPPGARLRLGSTPFRHNEAVSSLRFLADGKTLVSTARDGRVRFWDAAGRAVRPSLAVPGDTFAQHPSVAPDGRTVAVGRNDVALFDAAGRETHRLATGGRLVAATAFAPDGKTLAALGLDRTVRLYDPATGAERRTLGPPIPDAPDWLPPYLAPPLTFAPDGRTLAAADDFSCYLWDLETGKRTRWLGGHVGQVAGAAFTPDGQRLVTVASDDAARVWDVVTGKTILRLPHRLKSSYALALSADGSTAAFAGMGREVSLWRLADGTPLRSFEAASPDIHALAFAPDGRSLFVGASDWLIRTYEVASGREVAPPTGHLQGVHGVAFSPDGRLVATAGGDRAVLLWDATSGELRRRLSGHRLAATAVAFGPGGKTLFSYGQDRHLRAWDVTTGRETAAVACAPAEARSFAFAPDRTRAAFFGRDRVLRVWDAARGQELSATALKLEQEGTAGVRTAVIPYEESFWILTNDRLLRRRDADGGESRKARVAEPAEATPLLLSPDGRSLAFAAAAAPVPVLVESATGKERVRFEGAPLPVPEPLPAPGRPRPMPVPRRKPSPFDAGLIAWSPDGRTLATTAADGVVRFYDAVSGRKLAERAGPVGAPTALAFRSDDRVLAVAHADATVLLWDVPGPDAPGRFAPEAADAEALWTDLAADDAIKAYRAVHTLVASPALALPLLRTRLRPEPEIDASMILKVLERLDDDALEEREQATRDLMRGGKAVRAAAQKALASGPSPEARRRLELVLAATDPDRPASGEALRTVRAVEVAERLGTTEARRLLEALAATPGTSALKREARDVLRRLARADGR